MINKTKKTSLIIIVIGLVLILFGVTYSFFNYTEFSNELVTNNGEVYMKMYKDSNNITLNNVFPETYKKALYQNGEDGELREDNIIEFTVIGKNTYNNPVYYEIDLEYGDDVENKERIEDRYLRFELLDITDSNNVITLIKKKNYYSIDNKKIYVESISNTDTNYSKTYRLRMWYDENIIISDTDSNANFRASDLNNDKGNGDLPIYTDLYASVKVNVYGDFIEKTLYDETPSTCFTYVNVSEYDEGPGDASNKNNNINPKFLANPSNLDDEGLAITGYDITCGFDIVFPKMINNKPVVFIGDFHNMDNKDRNSISSIYISENIEEFDFEGSNSLFSSGSLSNIVVDPNNSVFDSRENCNALIETNSNTLLKGSSNTIIPNTVISIGENAFSFLNDLIEIYIPSSVIEISNGSFRACSNLESIIVDSNNSVYDSRNNCNAIINTLANELITGCKNTIIPNSVTSIGDRAFYDCSSLTNITIPNSVTSIGNFAFDSCLSLTNITIPNSVTSIGYSAFYYCDQVKTLRIPSSITYIYSNTFYNLHSLTDIYVSWTNPSSQVTLERNSYIIETYGKLGLHNLRLHVPSGTGYLYEQHSFFKDYLIIEDN